MKGFYPRGTKDDLAYYSRQFNAIEMNSTFYRIFPPEQFIKWRDRTPEGFKFFPKIPQEISHYKQLNNFQEPTDRFILAASELGDKLGTVFLQLKEQFAPNRFKLLQDFVEDWPTDLPLTVEVRHMDWFEDAVVANELYNLLSSRNTQFTLVDTPGRRDMLHTIRQKDGLGPFGTKRLSKTIMTSYNLILLVHILLQTDSFCTYYLVSNY